MKLAQVSAGLAAALAVFPSIGTASGVRGGGRVYRTSIDVSLVRLIAVPRDFDGVKVRVEGVVLLEGDSDEICLSEESVKFLMLKDCLALQLDYEAIGKPRSDLIDLSGEHVLLEGILDASGEGTDSLFSGSIKRVTRLESIEYEGRNPAAPVRGSGPDGADTGQECQPTEISRSEARSLVEAVPGNLAVEDRGGKLMIEGWEPDGGRNDEFFFFGAWASEEGRTSADNGLMGYFNVNKRTARVSDGVLFDEIHGKELEKLQMKLRRKHCIGRDLVEARRDDPTFDAPWPEIQDVDVSAGMDWSARRIYLDVPLLDRSGEVRYRLVCRGGSEEYLDALMDRIDINYVGPLLCILNEGSQEAEASLLSEDDSAAWFSRGQFRSRDIVGNCGNYPEFGRVRHFRLRGFELTMEVVSPEVEAGKVRWLTFRVRVRSDPEATTAWAEPVPFPDPRSGGGKCGPPKAAPGRGSGG